nr:Bll5685 protein [uncultured bacterium]
MTIQLKGSSSTGYSRQPTDAFTDLLFNTLIGFVFLFFIAVIFISPAKDTGKVVLDAQYLVTVTWPDGSQEDIDTWIEDPQGNVTWFRNRSAGLVHLDRDDRGMLNDKIEVEGKVIENVLNQEVAAVRGTVPGEYTVNLHYYESVEQVTVPVTVRVAKVNPVYKIYFNDTVDMRRKGEERTAVRFTILRDGKIGRINRLEKKLVTF